MMARPKIIFAMLICTMGSSEGESQARSLDGLLSDIPIAMGQWEVPGIAIAIVANDHVVLARGFGVRELGEPEPVDDETLFAIGSSTKAFTTALLGMLVDEGALTWDDPVIDWLPEFRTADPWITRNLTIRDLVAHRSGLEGGDRLWYGRPISSPEILKRVRHLRIQTPFRASFCYNNILYLAAGEIAARASRKPWSDLITDRIFNRIEMKRSLITINELAKVENVASPHAEIDGTLEPVPYRDLDDVAPAGAILSSAQDLANWLRLNLGEGIFEENQLLQHGTVREMQTPQIVMGTDPTLPESNFFSYGLGWFINDHRGRRIVHHGGNIDGMSCMVGMMPHEEVGVVILANRDSTLLPKALMLRVFDIFLGVPEKDWSGDLRELAAKWKSSGEVGSEKARHPDTAPSLDLKDYCGRYHSDLYGEVEIKLERPDRLTLYLGPAFVGQMRHWHYDTFRATYDEGVLVRSEMVTFHLNEDGEIGSALVGDLGKFERMLKDTEAEASAPPGESK